MTLNRNELKLLFGGRLEWLKLFRELLTSVILRDLEETGQYRNVKLAPAKFWSTAPIDEQDNSLTGSFTCPCIFIIFQIKYLSGECISRA